MSIEEELKTNYRNNFPIEYYDKIINGKMNNIEQAIGYWFDVTFYF